MSQQDENGRKAERELRESEERFRLLCEAAFEGIVVHDKGTILDANPSFEVLAYPVGNIKVMARMRTKTIRRVW